MVDFKLGAWINEKYVFFSQAAIHRKLYDGEFYPGE